MGVYNSPWQGDLYNHDAAAADFVSFCRQHKAAYNADKPRDGEGKEHRRVFSQARKGGQLHWNG